MFLHTEWELFASEIRFSRCLINHRVSVVSADGQYLTDLVFINLLCTIFDKIGIYRNNSQQFPGKRYTYVFVYQSKHLPTFLAEVTPLNVRMMSWKATQFA